MLILIRTLAIKVFATKLSPFSAFCCNHILNYYLNESSHEIDAHFFARNINDLARSHRPSNSASRSDSLKMQSYRTDAI